MSSWSAVWCAPRHEADSRRGILLPIVLVIIMTLTFAVSVFAEQMLAEYRATRVMVTEIEARNAAQSGVETLLVVAEHARQHGSQLDEPHGFASLATAPGQVSKSIEDSQSTFSIYSGRTRSSLLNGLRNESGKINLNGLPQESSQVQSVRQRLMALPKMTPQIADAIMDWVDADQVARPLGAEKSWYIASGATRFPPGHSFSDLCELLYVRGVTEELLYGEDTNRNGWLDDCEDDGDITLPIDDADGQLDCGWSAYLTVLGQESTYRSNGKRKVNVNQGDLVRLYDELLPVLGPRATTYVLALRLEGPLQRGNASAGSKESQLDERLRTADDRLKNQLLPRTNERKARTETLRGGLELGRQPAFTIRSVVDLIDQDVVTIIDNQQQLLKSPWSVAQLHSALIALESDLTTTDQPTLRSRINLFHAPLEVLRSVPGIDGQQATAIISRRAKLLGEHSTGARSIGWLVNDGLLTMEQLREIGPWLTAGGSVFAGSSVGMATVHSDTKKQQQSLCVGLHFVLDCSTNTTRLLSSQESMPFMLPFSERSR